MVSLLNSKMSIQLFTTKDVIGEFTFPAVYLKSYIILITNASINNREKFPFNESIRTPGSHWLIILMMTFYTGPRVCKHSSWLIDTDPIHIVDNISTLDRNVFSLAHFLFLILS